MQIYLQFLFRARNFSCEFWSVFYVNYAGCHPACCFLFCCLGAFLPINPLFWQVPAVLFLVLLFRGGAPCRARRRRVPLFCARNFSCEIFAIFLAYVRKKL